MAYDEDAVVEAVARVTAQFQPVLDDILARLTALEAGGGGGGTVLEVVQYDAVLSNGDTRKYVLQP